MELTINPKQGAFSSEKPTYSEKEIIEFYYASKRRHLDLNQVMREHFCQYETGLMNDANSSVREEIK